MVKTVLHECVQDVQNGFGVVPDGIARIPLAERERYTGTVEQEDCPK